MTWDYRVVRRIERGIADEYMGEVYAVHEVYYAASEPNSITENPVYPVAETIDELKKSYAMIAEAFNRPILDYETFTYPPTRKGRRVRVRPK
jgi:TFIIF-interacting CTD phosphatase-like protein